jgi:hypothetical protein
MSAEDRYGDVEKRQLDATIPRMQAPKSLAFVLRLRHIEALRTAPEADIRIRAWKTTVGI